MEKMKYTTTDVTMKYPKEEDEVYQGCRRHPAIRVIDSWSTLIEKQYFSW